MLLVDGSTAAAAATDDDDHLPSAVNGIPGGASGSACVNSQYAGYRLLLTRVV